MPELLQHALARGWTRGDIAASIMAIGYQLVQMAHTRWFERGVEAITICMELLLIRLCLRLRQSIGHGAGSARQQRRRLLARTLLVSCIRGIILIAVPRLVDLVRVMAPGLPPGGSNSDASLLAACTQSAGARACAARVVAHLRALVMLLLPVAWVHALLGAVIGWQLPPLEHALLQTVSVAVLMQRAPRVCRQFTDWHPANGHVVSGLYFVIQQAASLLCLGSRASLDAVAQDTCPCSKCIAVVWSLEVSLGLVWPTLMVWQGQLAAALEWTVNAAEQEVQQQALWHGQHRQQQEGRPSPAGPLATQQPAATAAPLGTAVAEYQGSLYVRICAPVLSFAKTCPGGWAMVVSLAALCPYLAAVLTEPRCPA